MNLLALLIAVSAADGSLGVTARGGITSLYVSGLEGITQTVSAATWPLPEELSGVRVTISNAPARLYGIAPFEDGHLINVQVSRNADLGTSVDVLVTQGARRIQANLPVNEASPGQLFMGDGAIGLFRHGDGSLVTAGNPALPREVISAFLTGLPLPDTPIADGAPAPSNPPVVVPEILQVATSRQYRLNINGVPARPLFLGLQPGAAGVYRADLEVPAGTSGRATAVFVEVSCTAFFGSCAAGGGVRTNRSSDPAILFVQ